jgi:predicted dehydrogenase
MVIDACKAGKHVSVQKPMAITVQEAQAMIDEAKANNVSLRIYENFVFYEPFVKALSLVEHGEIGDLQMIRIHFNTGTRDSGWKVPLDSWLWRFNQKKCGGGPIIFDHGYHLFSIARKFMGEVEKVTAWIDKTSVFPGVGLDAPATIMLKFKNARRYGVMDFCHTPALKIDSEHYSDDNRVEIIGEKGIVMINRCTTRTIDLPPLLLYKNGKTLSIPIEKDTWENSFVECTRHFISILENGGKPELDGTDAKSVLEMAIAAQISSREQREVSIEEIRTKDVEH